MTNTCWGCGHWIIGLGCTKDGFNELVVATEHNHTCNKWCPEGTEGTATAFMNIDEADGTSWADNEYLKDDESNL